MGKRGRERMGKGGEKGKVESWGNSTLVVGGIYAPASIHSTVEC